MEWFEATLWDFHYFCPEPEKNCRVSNYNFTLYCIMSYISKWFYASMYILFIYLTCMKPICLLWYKKNMLDHLYHIYCVVLMNLKWKFLINCYTSPTLANKCCHGKLHVCVDYVSEWQFILTPTKAGLHTMNIIYGGECVATFISF